MRPVLPAARIAAALALSIFLGSCAAAPPTTASSGTVAAPVSIASVIAPAESTRAAVARAAVEARSSLAGLEVEAQAALDGSWNGTAAETTAREAVTAALDAANDSLPGEVVLLDDSAGRTAELTDGILEEAGVRRTRLEEATAAYVRTVQTETEARAAAAAAAAEEQARRDAAAAARGAASVPRTRTAAPAAPAAATPGAAAPSSETREARLARLGGAVGVGVPIVVGRGGCDGVIGAGQTLLGCFDTVTARIYVTEQGLAKSDCALRGVIAHEWTHYQQFSGGRVQWTADGQVANRDALESEAYGAQARWGC
ncbi:MAG: hypothetical protein ABW204_10915 [Microbacteriaceae bacterium]